jgi:hypothetical protein
MMFLALTPTRKSSRAVFFDLKRDVLAKSITGIYRKEMIIAHEYFTKSSV